MKKLRRILGVVIIVALLATTAFAQYGGGGYDDCANYLKRVATNIIPAAANKYTIGSVTRPWKMIYAIITATSPFIVTDGTDTWTMTLDGSDAYQKWSDGDMIFQSDEGANPDANVYISGKGTGSGYLFIKDGSNANYYSAVGQVDSAMQIGFGSETEVLDFAFGNTRYLDIGANIETAIAAAAAGDTIVLAAGEYVLDNIMTVAKKVHIKGQGKGITTISTVTNDMAAMIDFTTGDGSMLSDLTLSMESPILTASTKMVDWGVAGTMRNVEFLDTSAGALLRPQGISVTAAKTVDVFNCTFAGSGAAYSHAFAATATAGATLNLYDCYATSTGGTLAGEGSLVVYTNNGTATINIYDGYYATDSATTAGAINCYDGAINVYGADISASGAGSFDVKRAAGTLTLYDTTLVNNTTSGTITYGGTVVSKGASFTQTDVGGKGIFVDHNANGIGMEIDFEATTSTGLYVQGDALTTGWIAFLASNSADTSARVLVEVKNDNAAAVGTTPFKITQDAPTSTNFNKMMSMNGLTIWISDGTAAQGNLTGVQGDICYNGSTTAGGMAFCSTTGTTWTDM